jgi:ABC-2 type transport system ATP-binding protein
VKRRIGVVPEDLALFDRLTADETLTFVAQVHGLDERTARSRAGDLLGLMDLTSSRGTLVADFSHGMRKKLSLATALLPAPRLLFLDEPFEGIDAVASRQIKDLLQSFVARGGTIFLTSHILEIVERLSTHIGVIDKGRLVAQGPIDELRAGGPAAANLEELFIGLVGGDAAGAAGVTLNWL